MAISRRNFIAATGSAGLIAGAPSIVRSQTGPIKLGSVLDNSGNLDIYGKPMVMATTLAVEEINAAGGLLGRKVQAIQYGDRIELIPVRPAKRMRGFLKGIDTRVPREGDRVRTWSIPVPGSSTSPTGPTLRSSHRPLRRPPTFWCHR